MAELNFDVLAFDSQQLPDTLPAPAPTRAPEQQCPTAIVLTAEQQESLGLHSDYIGLMDTPEKVLEHYRLLGEERKQRAAQAQAEQQHKERYDPVVRAERAQTRAELLAVANAANVAWREAVSERRRVLAVADAKVLAAREAYKRAKAAAEAV